MATIGRTVSAIEVREPGGPDRLLLIDDNPPDRVRYRHMLRRAPEPYELVEAGTAADGLDKLDGTIAAVLLDQDLPDMQGLEVLAAIRDRVDAPVVVMLTGEEDAAVCVEALKRGAADYLMKRRIDEDTLFRAVRGALERGRLERQVADQQRRLALFYRLASQTDDALFIIDPQTGQVTECNHSARQWLGVWPTDLGADPFVPSAFDGLASWMSFLQEATAKGSARFEWTVPAAGGDEVCEILARLVEEQGHPYIVAVGRDITTRIDHERALLDQTQRDALTGIRNRRAFDDKLAELWATARRASMPVAAVMIDVDHFKLYNDELGHQAGDECLRAVAAALQGVEERSGAIVARYGGEEFAALVPVSETGAARGVAEQLRQAVEALAHAHPRSSVGPHVTVSVGVAARVPNGDEPPAVLVEAADQALYRAKEQGRNRVVSAFPF